MDMEYFIASVDAIVIGAITKLSDFLYFSSAIGSYVVNFFVSVIVFLFRSIKLTSVGFNILFNDFMVFVQDILNICAICSDGLGIVITSILESLLNFFFKLKNVTIAFCSLPIFIYEEIKYIIDSCLYSIEVGAEHLKNALMLIGLCIWSSIMLLPYILVCSLSYMQDIVLDFANFLNSFVTFLVSVMSVGLIQRFLKIVWFFVDMPCEACIGLIVGITLSYLMYKKRFHLVHFVMSNYRFQRDGIILIFQTARAGLQQLLGRVYISMHILRTRRSRTVQNTAARAELSNGIRAECSSTIDYDDSMTLRKLQERLENEIEERLCTVCRERKKSVIVFPCRHLCMCNECVSHVKRVNKLCPICRTRIRTSINVYL